jgi:predicted extracellular nuclease
MPTPSTPIGNIPISPGLATITLPTPTTKLIAGTRISQIQGAQHRSPLDGQQVDQIYGLVTALTGNGFYIQDPNPDADLATSEGIFISYSVFGKVKVGDEVVIEQGKVREFNPKGIGTNSLTITQILTSKLSVLSSGNQLPPPIIIGNEGRQIPSTVIENDAEGFMSRDNTFDPNEDGIDFFEALESMRVQVNNALAVSTVSGYREFAVVPDSGSNASVISTTGALVIRQNDLNPERIMIDDAFIFMPDVRQGSRFTKPITGIITYDYTNYRLSPTQKLNFTPASPLNDALQYQVGDSDLSVATYNVENLDALDHPARLIKLADQIVNKLGAPDILGLQEVQDNDGVQDSGNIAANETLRLVITAIQKAGGPVYHYMNINPNNNRDGGQTGGNIRNVILYRTDRVSLPYFKQGDADTGVKLTNQGGRAMLNFNPVRIQPNTSTFQDSRKPLVAHLIFRNQDVYVVVNHFKSKGEDGPLYGDEQPPKLVTEGQRNLQAEATNRFVKEILAIDPEANVVVMGDLNDFYWSNPLKKLEGKELKNLIYTLDEAERYTYNFEGNSQTLDHILVSQSLSDNLAHFKVVHLNTAALPEDRVSDHDPIIAILEFQ